MAVPPVGGVTIFLLARASDPRASRGSETNRDKWQRKHLVEECVCALSRGFHFKNAKWLWTHSQRVHSSSVSKEFSPCDLVEATI